MKLIGLLSFYDEPIPDLVACITSLHDAGAAHLVAVDGAYALYPGGQARSPVDQHAAIVTACRHLGLGLTLHAPRETWAGNEVEKRTFLFRAAFAASEPGDWLFVIDADEVIRDTPDDLLEQLAGTPRECGDITEVDMVALRANVPNWPATFTTRRLYRAQPIRVVTNHVTYMTDDGRLLWGYEGGESPLEDALDLTGRVVMEHRPDRRPPERMLGKLQYYAGRDADAAERGDCELCDSPAVRLVPTRWRMTEIGPVADWMEACGDCGPKVEAVNRLTLQQLGVDPDSVTVENRMGQAPQRQAA